MKNFLLLFCACSLSFMACEPTVIEPTDSPKLIFKFKLDSTQARLDAFAQPVTVSSGNAAQHPEFSGLSAHKIELVPNNLTPVNGGPIVYQGAETSSGGSTAINFDQAIIKDNGEVFLEVPLADIASGNYEYIRVSVSYQKYDIYYNLLNVPTFPTGTTDLINEKGTLASFVGFNTYITTLTPKNLVETVNNNKLQGYWAFETDLPSPYNLANDIYSGTAQGTTVVNPLNSTAPTPSGSCLVTGAFVGNALEISGNETEDITVTLSFSTNNSFEWVDANANGQLDIDVNGTAETVVDMGLRGLQATFQ